MERATFVFSAPLTYGEPGVPLDRDQFEKDTIDARREFEALEAITVVQLHRQGIEVTYPPSLSAETVIERIEAAANRVRAADNRLFSLASRDITIRPGS